METQLKESQNIKGILTLGIEYYSFICLHIKVTIVINRDLSWSYLNKVVKIDSSYTKGSVTKYISFFIIRTFDLIFGAKMFNIKSILSLDMIEISCNYSKSLVTSYLSLSLNAHIKASNNFLDS